MFITDDSIAGITIILVIVLITVLMTLVVTKK